MSEISWKAIFAGLFVSLMSYLILGALGLAIGGSALVQTVVEGEGAGGLGVGSAVWLVLSTIVSLFLGAYAAGETGGLISVRIGKIQGVVISGLFFGLMLTQLGGAVGFFGRAVGQMAGSLGDIAENPQVQSVVNESFEGLDLKSPAPDVARGIAVRLLRGDTEGAKNFLAQQSGLTPDEANLRIRELGTRFTDTLRDIGAQAARSVSIAGWTLFSVFLLGTGCALLGGHLGAAVNLRRPMTATDERNLRRVA